MLLPTCNLCRHWMGASTSDMAVEHPWESFADQQTAAVNTGTWHHMAICAWGNAPNSCSQSHVTYFRPIHQIYIARSAMIYPEKSSNISIRIRSLRPHFPVASCCMPPQIKGTSLRKHACSRAKVGTAPMHRNAGSCWTSAHFGETSKTRETCVNTWGSHEFHNISRWNPKPLAHMMAHR